MQVAVEGAFKKSKSLPHLAERLYVATPLSPKGGVLICLTISLTSEALSIRGTIIPATPASAVFPSPAPHN